MLDEALVALAGQEGVGHGGVVAEDLCGCERVDLACYALVAEGASGRLLEAWWLRSLGYVSVGLLTVEVRGCTIFVVRWEDCGKDVGMAGFGVEESCLGTFSVSGGSPRVVGYTEKWHGGALTLTD